MNPWGIPDRESLENAAENNPDGYGYAIIIGDHIHTHRGMDAEKVINQFFIDRNAHPESYAIWHARWSTHGTNTKENCHPFKVGGSPLTYLAHNGIMALPIPKGDDRSDTHKFADDVLPALGVESLDDYMAASALEDWLGSDKLAVLSVDPQLQANLYILNENRGDWDKQKLVWYSNHSWQYSQRVVNMYAHGSDARDWTWRDGQYEMAISDKSITDAEFWERQNICAMCDGIIPEENDVCPYCDTCRYCDNPEKDCVCAAFSDPQPNEVREIQAVIDRTKISGYLTGKF